MCWLQCTVPLLHFWYSGKAKSLYPVTLSVTLGKLNPAHYQPIRKRVTFSTCCVCLKASLRLGESSSFCEWLWLACHHLPHCSTCTYCTCVSLQLHVQFLNRQANMILIFRQATNCPVHKSIFVMCVPIPWEHRNGTLCLHACFTNVKSFTQLVAHSAHCLIRCVIRKERAFSTYLQAACWRLCTLYALVTLGRLNPASQCTPYCIGRNFRRCKFSWSVHLGS